MFECLGEVLVRCLYTASLPSTLRVVLTIETALICNVVHQEDTHGASVVCGRDRPEAFLARCIPYLQLHSLAVQLDRSDLEVDADGRNEGGREGVLGEAQ